MKFCKRGCNQNCSFFLLVVAVFLRLYFNISWGYLKEKCIAYIFTFHKKRGDEMKKENIFLAVIGIKINCFQDSLNTSASSKKWYFYEHMCLVKQPFLPYIM